MEPPAITSAPEATEPTILTSPFSNTIDWPERTGWSINSDVASWDCVAERGSSGTSMARAGRVLFACKGAQASNPCQVGWAPSVPMMRIPRLDRLRSKPATSGCSLGNAPRSRTTGRPLKNDGERLIWASSASTQSSTGGSGASTSAMNDRPLTRINGRESAVGTYLEYQADAVMVNRNCRKLRCKKKELWIVHNRLWKSRWIP